MKEKKRFWFSIFLHLILMVITVFVLVLVFYALFSLLNHFHRPISLGNFDNGTDPILR